MRPIYLDIDPADANLTGFVSNATGAGPATLAANDSGDGLAHQVSIRNDTANDLSGLTFTITGTDADGNSQTEDVTGPGASATVESTKYFLTVTAVSWTPTLGANTVDIGWVDEVASQTIQLDSYKDTAPMIHADVTGTISLRVEVTSDDINRVVGGSAADQSAFFWVADSTNWTTGINADTVAALAEWPVRAMRVIIESYTNTAEVQVSITQASYR